MDICISDFKATFFLKINDMVVFSPDLKLGKNYPKVNRDKLLQKNKQCAFSHIMSSVTQTAMAEMCLSSCAEQHQDMPLGEEAQ